MSILTPTGFKVRNDERVRNNQASSVRSNRFGQQPTETFAVYCPMGSYDSISNTAFDSRDTV